MKSNRRRPAQRVGTGAAVTATPLISGHAGDGDGDHHAIGPAVRRRGDDCGVIALVIAVMFLLYPWCPLSGSRPAHMVRCAHDLPFKIKKPAEAGHWLLRGRAVIARRRCLAIPECSLSARHTRMELRPIRLLLSVDARNAASTESSDLPPPLWSVANSPDCRRRFLGPGSPSDDQSQRHK